MNLLPEGEDNATTNKHCTLICLKYINLCRKIKKYMKIEEILSIIKFY